MNDNLLEKRNEIIKLSSENTDDINMIIYIFAINHKLDNLLNKLDDTNIITNSKSIVKKGYLTPIEHFYQVLYCFINHINTNLWFISRSKNFIIEKIINNKEAEDVLFYKKYIHDNSNIPYYQNHFDKALVANFYRFIKTIPISEIIYSFFKKYELDIFNLNINSNENVSKLFYILKLICISNNHAYGLFYIFDDVINQKGIQHITGNFEILIMRAKKYEKIYNNLLKDC